MSTFSKRQYIWLESFFRDRIQSLNRQIENEHTFDLEYNRGRKEQLEYLISVLSKELESDSPEGFISSSFHHAIFSPLTKKESSNNDPEMTGDALSKYDFEL